MITTKSDVILTLGQGWKVSPSSMIPQQEWENDKTPLNAENLNRMTSGITNVQSILMNVANQSSEAVSAVVNHLDNYVKFNNTGFQFNKESGEAKFNGEVEASSFKSEKVEATDIVSTGTATFSNLVVNSIKNSEGDEIATGELLTETEIADKIDTAISVLAGKLDIKTNSEIFNDYENNRASGSYSHVEGFNNTSTEDYQHVQGKYNLLDKDNKSGDYAHIVGNGTEEKRSNAYTLDWYGNGWYSGGLDIAKGLSVTNKATFKSVVEVSGKATLKGEADIGGGLTVTGSTQLSSVDVSGDMKVANLDITGTLSCQSLTDSLDEINNSINDTNTRLNSLEEYNNTATDSMQEMNSNLTSEIDQLKERISVLENLIAAGTADPEVANLNENTKYYIKYEEL